MLLLAPQCTRQVQIQRFELGPNLLSPATTQHSSHMRLLDVMTHFHGSGIIVGHRSKLKSMVFQGTAMGRIGSPVVELSKL